MLMRHLLPCHRSYVTVLILTARKSTGKVNIDILVFTCRIERQISFSINRFASFENYWSAPF